MDETTIAAIREAYSLLSELFEEDILYVELSPEERAAYDGRIKTVKGRLGGVLQSI